MKKYIDRSIKWLVYIYISVLPWIIFRKELYYNTEEKKIMPLKAAGSTDYFLYGKAVFTIVAGLVLLGLLLVEAAAFHEKLMDLKSAGGRVCAVCIGIYIVCTVFSTIFATYRTTALTGGINTCEGLWVLLLYPVLLVAAGFVSSRQEKTKHLSGKWSNLEVLVLLQAVILLILSAIELLYKPVAELVAGHTLESAYVNMISLTFPSPAYCAGYIVLLTPFCIYFMLTAALALRSVIWSVLTVTTVAACFLTRSTAGFYLVLAECAGIVVYIVIKHRFQKAAFKGEKVLYVVKLVSVVAAVGVILLANAAAGGRIGKAVTSSAVNQTTPVHKSIYYKVRQIQVQDNTVTITGENNALICRIDEQRNIRFTDENGAVLDVSSDSSSIYFPKPYEMIQAGIENNALWLDLGYKGRIRFYMSDGKFYPMAADGSLIRDISSGTAGGEDAASKDYTKFDSIITGRGYIWRKSLPILKNTFVLGHGAGTFAFYFKQFDYVGLLNSQGEVDLLVDRPHSWYMQMAANQGVLCMAAVVVFIVTVCVAGSVKTERKKKPVVLRAEAAEHSARVAAVTAVIAFCIFEGITDGSVSVNPLLWVVLGGLAGR